MKNEAWKELDEEVLTTVQFCLANEVLDECSSEKITSAL